MARFYRINYVREIEGREDSCEIFYEYRTDARSYFDNVIKNPIIISMEMWEYTSNENGLFDGHILREFQKGSGITRYDIEVETFASGGGNYHAIKEVDDIYYVVSNHSLDELDWYEDEEMGNWIDGNIVPELTTEQKAIHKELATALVTEYPDAWYAFKDIHKFSVVGFVEQL
jgi:hypothetical protein